MANTEQTGKAKQNYTNEQKTKENQNKTKLKTTLNIKRMSNTGVNPGTQERQALPASYNTPIVLIMYKVSVMYLFKRVIAFSSFYDFDVDYGIVPSDMVFPQFHYYI